MLTPNRSRLLALVVWTVSLTATLLVGRPSALAEDPTSKGEKTLLIVAVRAEHDVLAPFVAHKKKLLPTELVALEDVLKKHKGADDAEKLKRYLYDRWKKDQIGYVLLAGDAEVIPIRYSAVNNGGGPGDGGWSFMPTDLYYADLAKRDGSFEDWNARKDGFHGGYHGELMGFDGKGPINVDAIDYVPEVAVGRWPVHDRVHLQTIAAKTIRYENHILADDRPAARRTAFVNGAGLEDVRQQMTTWAGQVEKVTRTRPVRLLYKDEGRDDKTPPPDEAGVEKVLNGGVGMIFHVGHGSETSWDGCLDLARLRTIRDAELPPVMFSVGCTTGRYAPGAPGAPYRDASGKIHIGLDAGERFSHPAPAPGNYQRGVPNPTGLGVEFLRGGKAGAVAYIGCAVGSQSCAWELMSGFIESYTSHKQPRLGDVWAAALTHYHQVWKLKTLKAKDWWNVALFDQGMTFHLLGDPSMRLPGSPIPSLNLLVNGSFEEGPGVDRHFALDKGSTSIMGWRVTRGQIDYVGTQWKSADGRRSIDLHGSPGYGGVAQEFDTVKGRRYRVTFALASSPKGRPAAKQVGVVAAGKTAEFSFDATGKTPENMGWANQSWEFEAVSDRTTLEIYTLEKTDPVAGPALDDVRVVSMPEKK